MASMLQNLLGGGVPPERQGRRPTAVGDRDAASRDTVYRKPAPKGGDKTSSIKKAGGGGGGKLPRQAPIPTHNPMAAAPDTRSTFPARPEVVPPQMPQMPAPLAGLPMELQDTGMPMPDPRLAGVPPMSTVTPPTSPAGLLAGSTGPYSGAAIPAGGPVGSTGPYSRDHLAAAIAPKPQPQQGSFLPGEDAMNQWGKQHLPWWLGGG